MTIYDVQNAQKLPIWKQRIIECRSSGMGVKAWCKQQGLDFTTYYRWERKILSSIIPAEEYMGIPLSPNRRETPTAVRDCTALTEVSSPTIPTAIVKIECESESEVSFSKVSFKVNGLELSVDEDINPAFLTKLLEAAAHAR